MRPAEKVNVSSAVAEMGDRLATIDMGQQVEGTAVFISVGGAGSMIPSNTMSPGPASVPSCILVYPAV